MARTFEENMNDKKLTVKSLRVLQEVEGGAFDKISSQIEETNQTIATLQGAQNRYWDSIADDNIITVEEKRILYKEKQSLDTEYSIVIQNAEKNKDYVDYTSLVEAYQNLNSYLAFIKVFENLGSNTKIDNRTEFYDAFDSYYIALNNVNQAILNKASVGDLNVGNPDKITGLKAVASEKGIYVSFNQLSSEVKNNIGKYIYKLNKGDGVLYLFESQVNGFTYEFDRLVDGFPEAEDIKDWEWTVSAVSVYGKENEESNIATVNVDKYGTWIPQQPEIITTEQKRFISFSFSQKLSSKEVYGQLRYGLTIQKPLIDSDFFYTPALDKIPTESETNYKLDTTEPVFVSSYFSQSLPLTGQNNKKWKIKQWQTTEGEEGTTKDSVSYKNTLPVYPSDAVLTYDENGQIIGVLYSETVKPLTLHHEYTLVDMPSPIDTMYKYKVVIWNKTTNQFYDVEDVLTVYARANSASDLVDNAITQNALAPDAVTTENIAAGAVTAKLIAAENILAKGARAGMVSTEGLQVDDSGFFASEPFNYKYHDPVTGEEKNYRTSAGEFFVGNSPDINDNRDEAEFLHFIKNDGQNYGGFWLKIKNFILKGLSTIIQGVFVVKKNGETDASAFMVANATDSADSATGVAERTLKINGDAIIAGTSFKKFKTNYYSGGFTMVSLGFTRDQKVSIKAFVSALLKKINTACFQIKFDWYTADAAYITDGTNEIYMSGGVLSGYTEELSGTWKSCMLFWFSNTGVTARISAMIYSEANIVTGNISILKSIDETYPVGTIYMSVDSTSPATLFGGYWVRLKDRFLLGAGDTYSAGATGGASSHTLTKAQMPRHSHTINHDHTIDNLLFTAPSSSYTYKWDHNAVSGIYGKIGSAYTAYNGSSNEVGSGESFSIMPPYTVVYMWKRVTEAEAATLSIT